jgi:hypothetical protein
MVSGQSIPIDQLCTAYTNDLCVYLTQCESAFQNVAQCVAETDCLGVATLTREVAAGAVGYDAAAVGACQAKFLADPCHFGTFLLTPNVFQVLSDCPGTLTPQSAFGDPCADSSECLAGNFCSRTGPVCPGTCKPYQSAGDSCGLGSVCTPGLHCIGGTCGPPQAVGTPCTTTGECNVVSICLNDPNCTSGSNGLWCDVTTQTCHAGVGVGATCGLVSSDGGASTTVECANGLWCDAFTNQAGTCRAFGGAGTPCNEYGCTTGFHCVGDIPGGSTATLGTCEPPAGNGQACTFYSDCAAGLGCPSGTCVPPTGVGGTCGADIDCQSGLFCSGGVCLTASYPGDSCADASSGCVIGLCKAGVCVDHLKAGQPCAAGSDCISGTCDNGSCLDTSVCGYWQ